MTTKLSRYDLRILLDLWDKAITPWGLLGTLNESNEESKPYWQFMEKLAVKYGFKDQIVEIDRNTGEIIIK